MKNITTTPPAPAQSVATSQGAPATSGKGYDTPAEKQQVYIPAAVWQGHPAAGGGGPTVSVEEALELGAIPGTIDLAAGTAQWPQRFFAPAPAQTAHTPGPWRVTEYGGEIAIHAEDNSKIALPEKWYASDRAEAESNARLIAASPCLLAALERLANAVDAHCRDITTAALIELDDATITARAAIAKATKGGK